MTRTPCRFRYACLWLGLLFSAGAVSAQPQAELEQLLVDFLYAQSQRDAAAVQIEVRMPRLSMPACREPAPFLPARNTRIVGNLTVGVRCPGDHPSVRYFQARVTVSADYYVAARSLMPGDVITPADVRMETGDLSRLPGDVATDLESLLGQAVTRRVAPGRPLINSMVEAPTAIDRGERVRVLAVGTGFSIASQGQALSAAPLGGTVRVRTDEGSIVSGIASDENTVTIRR